MGSVMEILQSGATHRREQAKIDANRIVQKSANEKEAALTSLQRFSQSLANQRRMEAAGSQYNAESNNLAAALDGATAGTFADRVRAAGAVGAATAMAAAGGVGGSTIEAYKQTVRLSQQVQEESNLRAVDGNNINASMRKAGIIQDAVAGLSNEYFAPNFDYTIWIDHVEQKNKIGAAIAVGVASYFGGPQAGMATADAIASGNRAANGDTAGANQLMNSAAGNAMKGYEYWKANREVSTRAGGNSGITTPSSGSGFWGSESNSSVGFKANGNSIGGFMGN